ncbi:MAG TPA: extracellular solute-binding protein [Candidatus Limnocylindrales bacterium]|nr:extracellular solute-binding protein [Candidatus Limnocylindrales bacterium]
MRTTLAPIIVLAALLWLNPKPLLAANSKPAWQLEWEKTVEAAKNEGKLVAALPASAELRKAIGDIFPRRFPGIELDLTNARGPSNAGKIAAEHAAGVRYFDLLISGTSTPFTLLTAGILEPAEPLLILPEVKDPKRWFGGHIWLDKAKKFIYAFQVYQSENIWHNPTLMKPEEVRSYDELLNPKWKGKIGILDPRSAGAGTATWAFFLKIKGEEYLKKLAAQEMFLSRDQRQLADGLAKGKTAITIGLSYYTFAPFLKAGLAVKPLPDMKEGTYTSCGSSATSIVKNSPHPNATKVFVNWLFSQEGQEIYGKAMGQATRRLDVDTKWMVDHGVPASKDFLSVEENNRLENYGEDTVGKYWARAVKIAEEVFK